VFINLIGSGGAPSISGSARSPATASCQVWRMGLALARKNQRGRSAVPFDKQSRSANASSAATVIPCA